MVIRNTGMGGRGRRSKSMGRCRKKDESSRVKPRNFLCSFTCFYNPAVYSVNAIVASSSSGDGLHTKWIQIHTLWRADIRIFKVGQFVFPTHSSTYNSLGYYASMYTCSSDLFLPQYTVHVVITPVVWHTISAVTVFVGFTSLYLPIHMFMHHQNTHLHDISAFPCLKIRTTLQLGLTTSTLYQRMGCFEVNLDDDFKIFPLEVMQD